jgi:cobalt-zinc-cadmium efflux system outer membrane protein
MRTNSLLYVCCLLVVYTLLPACAAKQEDAGFEDVRETVGNRIGRDVRWNRGTPEDYRASEAVNRMLADGVTGDEAVQVALLNNRHMQATYESLGVAQADLVQAGLLKNPVFGVELGFVEGGGVSSSSDGTAASGDTFRTLASGGRIVPLHTVPTPPGTTGGDVGNTTLDLSLAFDFLDVFYMPLRKSIARERFEETKAQVTGDVLRLASEVRTAFYELQAAQQLVELRRTVLQAAELSHEMSERLHRAGNMTDLQLSAERGSYERARIDLAISDAEVVRNKERLNRLMGLWGEETTWQPSGALREPPTEEMSLDQLESRAVEQSLELEAVRRRIRATGRALGLSRATGLIPEAELGVTGTRASGIWVVGPTLAVPIPIFDWGQARRAALMAELRRQQQHYAATAIDLRSEVRDARAQLVAARELEAHYRTVLVPLHAQLVEQTQAELNAMLVGPLELLEAKQQEIQTRRDHLQSLLAYWIARTELEQLLVGASAAARPAQAGVPLLSAPGGERRLRSGGHH